MQRQVKVRCGMRRNRSRANFMQRYLRRIPWVFISLVAAVVLLVATLLQTVLPFYKWLDLRTFSDDCHCLSLALATKSTTEFPLAVALARL